MIYEEAASAPCGALTSLSLLRKAKTQRWQKILLNGASESIGSVAAQLAKYFRAEVTGGCGIPRLEFVKTLGADRVLDYTGADFTRNDKTYDLILTYSERAHSRAVKTL
jgi:NADPH:quinone reductase-like Zn-dependent oxidoreductase